MYLCFFVDFNVKNKAYLYEFPCLRREEKSLNIESSFRRGLKFECVDILTYVFRSSENKDYTLYIFDISQIVPV